MQQFINSFLKELEKQSKNIQQENTQKMGIFERVIKSRAVKQHFNELNKELISKNETELKSILSSDKSLQEAYENISAKSPELAQKNTQALEKISKDKAAIIIDKLDEQALANIMPFNPISGNAYKGTNAIKLLQENLNHSRQDPRYLTKTQAQRLGATLMPTAKPVEISFFYDKNKEQKAKVYHVSEFKDLALEKTPIIIKNPKEILAESLLILEAKEQRTKEKARDLKQEKSQTLQKESPKTKPLEKKFVYIKVDFKDKERAKDLGAKWDKENKSWYARQELMPILSKSFKTNEALKDIQPKQRQAQKDLSR